MLFIFLYILLNAAEKLKVVLFLCSSFINFIRKKLAQLHLRFITSETIRAEINLLRGTKYTNLNPANSKSDPVYHVEKPNQ